MYDRERKREERESGVFSPPQTRRGNKNQPKNDLAKPKGQKLSTHTATAPSQSLFPHPSHLLLLALLFHPRFGTKRTTSFRFLPLAGLALLLGYSLSHTCAFCCWWTFRLFLFVLLLIILTSVGDGTLWLTRGASTPRVVFGFLGENGVCYKPVTISSDRFV